jgi:uncharacterized protein (TIGR00730 family)
MTMRRMCVFCGSSPGANPAYLAAARALGQALVQKNTGLVYGGGSFGVMGEIARAVLAAGGEAIGVIPGDLMDKEIALGGLSDLRVVKSMAERKALMADLSDGFITLPGGYGTLDELFEILSISQLGNHEKPCGLLNVAHYYDDLLRFLDHTVDQFFVQPEHRAMILVDDDPVALLDRFDTYQPPHLDKADWVRRIDNAQRGEVRP